MPNHFPINANRDRTRAVLRLQVGDDCQGFPPRRSSEASLENEERSAENQTLPIDPAALQQFIDLYQKQYGVRLDPGPATVKARRLLSLFRLIAAHGDKELRANMKDAGKEANAEP